MSPTSSSLAQERLISSAEVSQLTGCTPMASFSRFAALQLHAERGKLRTRGKGRGADISSTNVSEGNAHVKTYSFHAEDVSHDDGDPHETQLSISTATNNRR